MKGFEARMQTLIFRFMALSPLTLHAGFPLNLSIGVLADRRAVIKFAFKLTGFSFGAFAGLGKFSVPMVVGLAGLGKPSIWICVGETGVGKRRCSPSV